VNINLTPFVVLGVLLVMTVIAMIIWRKVVASAEDDALHVLDARAHITDQLTVAQRLEWIDKWGKTLTVITVVYVIIVGSLVVYQQFVRASNLGV